MRDDENMVVYRVKQLKAEVRDVEPCLWSLQPNFNIKVTKRSSSSVQYNGVW